MKITHEDAGFPAAATIDPATTETASSLPGNGAAATDAAIGGRTKKAIPHKLAWIGLGLSSWRSLNASSKGVQPTLHPRNESPAALHPRRAPVQVHHCKPRLVKACLQLVADHKNPAPSQQLTVKSTWASAPGLAARAASKRWLPFRRCSSQPCTSPPCCRDLSWQGGRSFFEM